jgi:sialic acid synthase
MREITFNDTTVSDDQPAYVIAEIGHNHQGELEKARQLFESAKMAGVNAVKLQKRDNRALFTKSFYDKPYENENSYGKTYGEHRDFLEFGKKEYQELQKLAQELELDFFATAFDHTSADFLEDLDIPFYKIASADLNNTPLLKHVAGFGKPMIISTGGAQPGRCATRP